VIASVACSIALSFVGAGPTPSPYAGSKAEARAVDDGYRTLEVLEVGDGIVVAERGAKGVYLSWLRPDGRRWSRLQRLGPWTEGRVARLERVPAEAPGFLIVLREEAPDEVTERVRYAVIDGDRIVVRFERAFPLPERRVDASDVRYGAAEPSWSLDATDEGPRIVWVRGPRVLTVPGAEGPVRFTIGAETTVFGGDAGALGSAQRDVYRDFLPPLKVDFATARHADAEAEVSEATDGDLGTAWSVPERQPPALTVQLGAAAPVRMIRVVPGCARDADAWAGHAELEAFRLDVGGTLEIEVDRSQPGRALPGVRAWADFPLSEAFGRQVVVFLESPRHAGWVRVAPLRTSDRRRPACVAEISVH
jgi:hypothetical protein